MQYFIDFVSTRSAETNKGCGGTLDSHFIANCVKNIGIKLQWKMFGMFFSGHSVVWAL